MIINEVLRSDLQPAAINSGPLKAIHAAISFDLANTYAPYLPRCFSSSRGRMWRSPTSSYLLLEDEVDIVTNRRCLEGYVFDKVWTRGQVHPAALETMRAKERMV